MMKPYGGAIDIWEVGKGVGNVGSTSATCWIAWCCNHPSTDRVYSILHVAQQSRCSLL